MLERHVVLCLHGGSGPSPDCSSEIMEARRKGHNIFQVLKEKTEWERLEIFFKKIRDTEGTFHTKIGTINDRNCIDLTEAEDIKKRWQKYTEELYKKVLMTKIITMV